MESQAEMDTKKQQQAEFRRKVTVIVLVAAALCAIGTAGVLGVKNVSVVAEVKRKLFTLKSKSCGLPRMNWVVDMYKAPVRYTKDMSGHKKKEDKVEHRTLPKLDELVDSMSLEDWAGQIVQPEQENAMCWEIRDTKPGTMFFAGHSSPGDDTAQAWKEKVHPLQDEAVNTAPHHIPLFIGVDTIHGMSHMKNAVLFPHNLALGCTQDEELVEQVGRITALESNAGGVNWGFSPCLAVATDVRWGRVYESFSQDPDLVGKLGAAYIRGAKGVKKEKGSAFVTCAKHFVADGGVRYGTGRIGTPLDRGDYTGTMEELRKVHLKPYEYAVKAGVESVMASFSSVNGELNHGHKGLLTGELKERLGFKGFVSSDYAAINGLAWTYEGSVAKAINAGIDSIMMAGADGWKNPHPGEVRQAIINNVNNGNIKKERVRDAAKRILWAKYESGLMEHPHVDDLVPTTIVGHEEHVALARKAVQQSTVILKNEKDVLPLNVKEKKICVVGDAADNDGKLLGGWTLDWQSHSGHVDTIVTNVVEGLSFAAKEAGADDNIHHSPWGDCQGADVALVVVGEDPYAEYMGDVNQMPRPNDLGFVEKITKDLNMPVVLLSVAARPIDIQNEKDKAAAIVAAFTPGSEGGHGIADILLGKVKPTGKLSLDWPASGKSMVRDAPEKDLIYHYGDGLTWKLSNSWFGSLAEDKADL